MQPMLTMAVRAAKQAGELIAKAAQQLQFVDIEVEAKGINDFVTRVDKNAERLIIENLRKAYPIHSFQGEESGFIEGQGVGKDWLWIIDPLDGTTNFIHGFPQYAVSIAVQHKGQTEHAVVYNPITEECFSASRGYGATLNGRRLRVTLGLSPWDMAAGDLLIREAGGMVCDTAGGHNFLKSGNIVTGNIKVMKALVTTISPHLPDYMRR